MTSPVRAGQAGELAIALRAIGLQRSQKRALGIEANCLGSDLADHVNIIDPERPGRQHLKPEPRRVQATRRQIDARTALSSQAEDTLNSERRR